MKLNLNKLAKKEWYIEHFNGCPAFVEMTGFGFTSRLYKGLYYSMTICYYRNREGDWLSLKEDQRKIGSTIVKKYLKNKKTILDLYRRWLKNYKLMFKNFYRLYREDLSVLNDKQLFSWAQKVYNYYRFKIFMPGFLDAYMFYADQRFDELLKKFCEKRGITNYQKIYAILSAPVEPSFIFIERKELEKIVKLMKRAGFTKNCNLTKFLKNHPKFQKLLDHHLFKYVWIKGSYVGSSPYTLKEIEETIMDILLKGKRKDDFKKNRVEKKKLIKKYKFTPEIIALSELTELFIKWQDLRKEYTLTFIALQEKILREISRRTKIELELLRYCRSSELWEILTKKFDIKKLKKRQKSCLFIYRNGKIIDVITGNRAKIFFQKVSHIEIKKIKELKGFPANLGRVNGKVKIIKSLREINKVSPGDILVTSMTRPEYLSALVKAAAIVTDDGGITCHAAIISRELKKPCIVGTKIATKVLKDGDLIEVNANQGVITVIKRK